MTLVASLTLANSLTEDEAPLGPDDRSGLDETTLRRLLALAGPSDGPELMRRLVADVRSVACGLKTGLMQNDRAAMRHHSHILLAIAGAIGAPRIHALAAHLNTCAKDTDCTEAKPEAIELLHRVDDLILRLRSMAAELGPEV